MKLLKMIALFAAGALACPAMAWQPVRPGQQGSTVFLDDSVGAREGLARVRDLVGQRNFSEAIRVLQEIIDRDADRVLEAPGESDLFISVREHAHRLLGSNPDLLERYRQIVGPRAAELLSQGQDDRVERGFLMTAAGFDAALRVAQRDLESARFEAARMVLEQLERHPDRVGLKEGVGPADPSGARDAARLALLVSRYLDRASVRAWAERWARECGDAGVMAEASGATPVAPPPGLAELRGRSPLGSFSRIDLSGLEGGPLQSAWLSAAARSDTASAARSPRAESRQQQELAWTLPTIARDTVYVNDGRAISALDRFTLTLLWRIEPGADPSSPLSARGYGSTYYGPGLSRQLEDASTVAVDLNVVVAASGLPMNQTREGDDRLHGIDAATGRELWSVAVGSIDESLRGGTVRGAPVIDGDTAVFCVRKYATSRRVISSMLVGLDLHTGATRWVRLIGSVGWLGQQSGRVSESPLADRGVVYRTDEMGFIAAVNAANGRVIWVRRTRAESVWRSGESSPPWGGSVPVMDGDRLITLSPSRDEVLWLDRSTGMIGARRESKGLAGPLQYLVLCGTPEARRLAVVGGDRLSFLSADPSQGGGVTLSPMFRQPEMAGRVVSSPEAVIVPLRGSVAIIDPASPANARTVKLESSGNMVFAESGMIACDAMRLHAYVEWDVARALLVTRIGANPDDPRPALALAQLAYRAGRAEQIAPAAEKALDAIARNPTSEASRAARAGLFESLALMVDPGEDASAAQSGIRDLATLEALVRAMGRAAETPGDHVAHLMALGRLCEAQGKPAGAAEAYQSVLLDSELAGAAWRRKDVSTAAGVEATGRLRSLLKLNGRAAYAAFDAELDRELARVQGQPGGVIAAYEGLAERYPVAARSAELWMSAATERSRAGDVGGATLAFARAMQTAEWALEIGDAAGPLLGEIIGRQIEQLAQQQRFAAAAQLLDRSVRAHPGLAITSGGRVIDASKKLAELGGAMSAMTRLARLGGEIAGSAQVVDAMLLRPVVRAGGEGEAESVEHALFANASQGSLMLLSDRGDGVLSAVWTRPFKGPSPVLLRLTARAAYLYWSASDGGRVERVDCVTGNVVWATPALGSVLPRAMTPGDEQPEEFTAPLDGQVRTTDFLVAMDEKVVAMVQRTGRIAVFDNETGRMLWSGRGVSGRVHDVAAGSGALAIVGSREADANQGGQNGERAGVEDGGENGRVPAMAVLDLNTGKVLHETAHGPSDYRWVRLAGTKMVLGLSDRVICEDLLSGRPQWAIEGPPALATAEAWIFGNRLFLVDRDRSLWLANITNGQVRDKPLDTRDRISDVSRVTATAVGENVLFSSRSGVVIFDPSGKLVGVDAVRSQPELLHAGVGENLLVTADSTPTELDDGRDAYRLYLLTTDSGKLVKTRSVVSYDPISELSVLDGKILISAGAMTLVIPTVPGAGASQAP